MYGCETMMIGGEPIEKAEYVPEYSYGLFFRSIRRAHHIKLPLVSKTP